MKIKKIIYIPTSSFCDWKRCRYYIQTFNNKDFHSSAFEIKMNLDEYKALNINDELKPSARFHFSLVHFDDCRHHKITLCPHHFDKLLEKRTGEILYELI